jgi:hypothetical protein
VTVLLAVDLAAKYSAACLMRDDYQVLHQFDSWGLSEADFVYRLTHYWTWHDTDKTPRIMVVEDLPHGLKYSTLIKAVCRIQGRIAQALDDSPEGAAEDMVFVAPATWRAHYEGMERGTGAEAVFPASRAFGYSPPDLMRRAKGNGGKTRARKVASDYCSAYLIARWAVDMKKTHETYDVPGTSRYNTAVIRKKDFDDQDS